MKKSRLRHIIRQIIKEQRDEEFERDIDDIDIKPKPSTSAAPPPNGCQQAGGKVVVLQKCVTNNLTGYCCAKINNNTPTSNNIGELHWLDHPSNPNLDGWYKIFNVVAPQSNHHAAQFCLPNPGPPTNITTVPGPCANAPNPACVGFDNGICGECMNPGVPSQQYLEAFTINYNHQPGAYYWHMLANPGRSNGAYYHQIVNPGGGCDCCHDPNANPCQGQGCNTPPPDWNQPFNPPMTPVCLNPTDPQYQVGYPCDCWTNNTPC